MTQAEANNPHDLLPIAAAVTAQALASGVLAPLKTQTHTFVEHGVTIQARYIDALAKKDVERAISGDRPAGAAGKHNPFLPFEPALYVADAGSDHVIILNKFPTVANHVLLIPRAFVDQEAVIEQSDFIAIAYLMAGMHGAVFFNGGRTGGGSQPHRHYQLIPGLELPIESIVPRGGIERAQQLSVLPFRHAFMHHRFDSTNSVEENGALLFDVFNQCCASAGVEVIGDKLSPFNLLLTREWMMVIPRTRECWEHEGKKVSINALGFGGLLLVRSPEQLPVVEKVGALKVLATVTE